MTLFSPAKTHGYVVLCYNPQREGIPTFLIYVGSTNDLNRRLASHNGGTGSVCTKEYQNHVLVACFVMQNRHDETNATLDYMQEFGTEIVRGGAFANFQIYGTAHITAIDTANDSCFYCHKNFAMGDHSKCRNNRQHLPTARYSRIPGLLLYAANQHPISNHYSDALIALREQQTYTVEQRDNIKLRMNQRVWADIEPHFIVSNPWLAIRDNVDACTLPGIVPKGEIICFADVQQNLAESHQNLAESQQNLAESQQNLAESQQNHDQSSNTLHMKSYEGSSHTTNSEVVLLRESPTIPENIANPDLVNLLEYVESGLSMSMTFDEWITHRSFTRLSINANQSGCAHGHNNCSCCITMTLDAAIYGLAHPEKYDEAHLNFCRDIVELNKRELAKKQMWSG